MQTRWFLKHQYLVSVTRQYQFDQSQIIDTSYNCRTLLNCKSEKATKCWLIFTFINSLLVKMYRAVETCKNLCSHICHCMFSHVDVNVLVILWHHHFCISDPQKEMSLMKSEKGVSVIDVKWTIPFANKGFQ